MTTLNLKAENRKVLGRKVKKLRQEGVLPANIYGKKVKSLAIQVDLKDFEKVYADAGETGLVELDLGKDKKPVLVDNVQLDVLTSKPLHVDFVQVDLKVKTTAEVPVELVGESPVEKQSLGTVVLYVDEIEVEALPQNLPEKFEIDATKLTEVDQSISVKDLAVDSSKVKILTDLETLVVKVEPPQKEEELPQPAVVAEGETTAVEGDKVETSDSVVAKEDKDETSSK